MSITDNVIDAYTVSDGVADGTFVLAPRETTREAGYPTPVTFTREAWADVVEWTRDDGPLQDETGRLWDVLTTMRGAAKRAAADPGERFGFHVFRIPNTTRSGRPSESLKAFRVRLEIVCQAWDTAGLPCLIVLLPGED